MFVVRWDNDLITCYNKETESPETLTSAELLGKNFV